IVLDELAHEDHPLIVKLAKDIDFITMGSPITHLYQEYFPGDYPPWTDTAFWQKLYGRLRRWRHFYRVDDFVGMSIEPPVQHTVDFIQRGIGAGGHTNYWDDDRFMAFVHGLL
ncbi:MAG: hypothetical protein KDE47_35060, partial [Caldilineaceae bacterium]|nr:hypothetical protein [Caldilineaceae bacterium]